MRTLLVLAFVLLSGCSTSRIEITPLEPASEAAPVSGGDIQVTTGDVDGSYEELAILTVGPDTGDDATRKLIARLREAARRVGADAVVRVDFDVYGRGENGDQTHMATGTAVRYR